MNRQALEKYQVLVYLAAVASGLTAGFTFAGRTAALDVMLWPLLGVLLYATFSQVPLTQLQHAIKDVRFIQSAIIGNFVLIPAIVWGLMHFLPDEPSVRLGVALVLLVPCTDWFITFTHLGGGNTKYAIAFSPVSLLLQLVLLPFYLWLFLGETVTLALARQEILAAFGALIVLPLLAAFATERWVEETPDRKPLLDGLAWLPVPLLALVIFVIAATQVNLVAASLSILGWLFTVFVAFLFAAALLAWLLARCFRLPPTQGRVLAFSLGTRNSFVVLPLALALPPSFELAVVAIVFQSLVELMGMVFFLWWIPNRLFPQNAPRASETKSNPTDNRI